MSEWRPIQTAPCDQDIWLKLDCGSETWGIKSTGPDGEVFGFLLLGNGFPDFGKDLGSPIYWKYRPKEAGVA